MIQLSIDGEKKFIEILMELARAYRLRVDDLKAYLQEVNEHKLIGTTINPPHDLQEVMLRKEKEPCVYQLYHTAHSLSLIRTLAISIRKTCNLNCFPFELHSILEAVIYEYVNKNPDDFYDSVAEGGGLYNIRMSEVKEIATVRILVFKKEFSTYIYQFPITMFNLSGDLKLSDSIQLLLAESQDLEENELTMFKGTRVFDYNYYLEVSVNTRCSEKLSLQQAEKARDATCNILKLLATHYSPRAIPLLTSTERNIHPFNFHRFGKNRENMDNATVRHFPSFQFDSKEFWEIFHQSQSIETSLINLSFQMIELLIPPNFSNQRVVERLERSLLWYGDAVSETSFYQQVQKLVISMEALVNFHDQYITETFKRRVAHLNITHLGINDDVEKKAKQLYEARSKIVHGTTINIKLNFCVITFCSETLLRAIYYFSLFGFEKTKFNKTLPKFLDELPRRVVLRDD